MARVSAAARSADSPWKQIIELMVGRSLTEQFPHVPHTPAAPMLELTDLQGRLAARRQLDVASRRDSRHGRYGRRAGRTELLRTVFALDPVRSGQVKVLSAGAPPRPAAGPRQRIEQGLGLLSEDRKGEGLALIRSIADNLTYTRLSPYSRWGFLHLGRRRQAVRGWLARLRVHCRSRAGGRRVVRRQSAKSRPGPIAASASRCVVTR